MPFRPSGLRSVGTGAPGMGRLWRPNPAEISRYAQSRTDQGAPAVLREASAWYDMRDLASSSDQTLRNRNNPSATAAQFGSTSGSDTNDPVRLPHSGTNYVYLPGTASNNLSIAKGAWAGTLHVTATLTDGTTATFTTTASPVLIGGTLLAAGRYKRFDVRDTDGSGTLRATINVATETLGQASWTCTTGQTVTVNRSTSGITTAVVTRPLAMLDGTDDYLRLRAGDTPNTTATTGAYTVAVLFKPTGLGGSGSTARLFSSGAFASGLTLYRNITTTNIIALVGGASAVHTAVTGITMTVGSIAMAAAVHDTGNLYCYTTESGLSAGVSTAGVGVITHATPNVGSLATSVANPLTGEVFAVVTWSRALTQVELDAVSSYLLGSYV